MYFFFQESPLPRSLKEAKLLAVAEAYQTYGYDYASKDPLGIFNK